MATFLQQALVRGINQKLSQTLGSLVIFGPWEAPAAVAGASPRSLAEAPSRLLFAWRQAVKCNFIQITLP